MSKIYDSDLISVFDLLYVDSFNICLLLLLVFIEIVAFLAERFILLIPRTFLKIFDTDGHLVLGGGGGGRGGAAAAVVNQRRLCDGGLNVFVS